MLQHVKGSSPTHRCSNTLDLVVTPADRLPTYTVVAVQPTGAIVDHSLVISHLPVKTDSPSPTERLVHGWRRVNREELQQALKVSQLCAPGSTDADVDELFATSNAVLHRLRRVMLFVVVRDVRCRDLTLNVEFNVALSTTRTPLSTL